jgi:hypothetical protein
MNDTTTLNLLTAEGAVTLSFATRLTPEQYQELHATLAENFRTQAELCHVVQELAAKWQVAFSAEGC